MPDTRTTTLLSVIGVGVSILGVWIAYSQYRQKSYETRPALDIAEAQVIRGLNGRGYKIQLTIHNRGTVEASSVEVHTYEDHALLAPVSLANTLANNVQSASVFVPTAEKSSDSDEFIFRGSLHYANRLSGQTYDEPWCFHASIPPVDWLHYDPVYMQPIALASCKAD